MRHDVQVQLIKQLIARLDAGTNVDAGGLRHQATSTYTDSEHAERERREFFLALPQCVGMSGDLAGPGAFLTNNDLGIPILAIRADDGQFQAFVNSCRHRGAILETEPRGVRRRFTCPFHAWSYDTGGSLVGLPKPDHFGDVDTSCHGLIPLPAEERHGLLFVHPDPHGEIDLDDLLGEWFNDEFPTWNLGGMVPINQDAYDTACNWKLAMDTFGETYHFSTLHKATLFNDFHGNVQCYDDDADVGGHSHRMILCRRDIDLMRQLPEDQWDITVAGLPVYWIFPNVILMPFRAGVFLVRAYPSPDDPGRHLSRIDFYMKPELQGATGPEALEIQMLIGNIAQNFAEIIRDEDYVMGESQQAAAKSGALSHIIFGRNEPALHHYHETYARKLGLPVEPLIDAI
jgi:phenylpropionate dioxygenase-like ring-hydroxylating dioxygenase large terminal subunit